MDVCEQATGCLNTGGFRDWARQQGFKFCEVFDWTSSAGDWSFIVSRDGDTWYVMTQENNWPRSGFTRNIDKTRPFTGAPAEVFYQLFLLYG